MPLSNYCKPLSSAPKRLQGLILRSSIQCSNHTLQHRPGKCIPISDTPSRAPELETVNNVSLSAINVYRQCGIRDATEHDDTLKALRYVIVSGWPDSKTDVPQSV